MLTANRYQMGLIGWPVALVAVLGNRVTLNGIVDSIYQKDEAGRIAWDAPGLRAVDNELVIDYDLV